MQNIDKILKKKKKIRDFYERNLNESNNFHLVPSPLYSKNNYWLNIIRFKNANYSKVISICKKLQKKGIETREFYPALSLQDHLKKYRNENLKFSENVFKKLLWLPSSNSLTKNDVKEISSAINLVT